MKLGVDLSIMEELYDFNPHYFYEGKEIEVFSFFANHSKISTVRLRVWVDPFDIEGKPYGGGTCDLITILRLAKKARDNGMSVLIDFHYSDFWVDPSRQICPKAWQGKTFQQVKRALYSYTKKVLTTLKKENVDVIGVQVGNEITNGMTYPYGQIEKEYHPETGGGFKGHAYLLKSGIKAVREIFPEAKVVIHLEHSGSNDMQDWYYSKCVELGVDFDVMGESYYPYWHGPIVDFIDNITKLKNKFHKEIWVVEIGYEFSRSHLLEDETIRGKEELDKEVICDINEKVPSPFSKEGQAKYMATMLEVCKKLGIEMVYYWEPTWIYCEGDSWAKPAGEAYCGLVPGAPVNSWANSTLFDFDGNANPAIDVFTQDFIDKL